MAYIRRRRIIPGRKPYGELVADPRVISAWLFRTNALFEDVTGLAPLVPSSASTWSKFYGNETVLDFSGTNNVHVADPTRINQLAVDPLTIILKIGQPGASDKVILMNRSVWNGTTGVELFFDSSSHYVMRGSSSASVTSASIASAGDIVAFVFDGTTGRIHINGKQDATGTIDTVVASSDGKFLIGEYGSTSYNFTGSLASVCLIGAALSAEEANRATRDPYRLFRPANERIWVPVASGGSSVSVNGSGTILFDGNVSGIRTSIPSPSGTLDFTGNASVANSVVPTVSGGVEFSGSATIETGSSVSVSGSGSVDFSGVASVSSSVDNSTSGGMDFSGSVTGLRIVDYNPSGGVVLDGTATALKSRVVSGSGTLQFSGSAQIDTVPPTTTTVESVKYVSMGGNQSRGAPRHSP